MASLSAVRKRQQALRERLKRRKPITAASAKLPAKPRDDVRLKADFRDVVVRLLAEASLFFPIDARLLSWKLDNVMLATLGRAHRLAATGSAASSSGSSSSGEGFMAKRNMCLEQAGISTRLYEAYTSWSMSKKIQFITDALIDIASLTANTSATSSSSSSATAGKGVASAASVGVAPQGAGPAGTGDALAVMGTCRLPSDDRLVVTAVARAPFRRRFAALLEKAPSLFYRSPPRPRARKKAKAAAAAASGKKKAAAGAAALGRKKARPRGGSGAGDLQQPPLRKKAKVDHHHHLDHAHDHHHQHQHRKRSGGDADDLASLLAPSFKDRAATDQGKEMLDILGYKTYRDKETVAQFRTEGGTKMRAVCEHNTKIECRIARRSRTCCSKVHWKKVIRPHTDESMGNCSYLDGCRHLNTCKYIHYVLDTDPDDDLGKDQAKTDQRERQWINCDVRKFDFSVLVPPAQIASQGFSVIMADPPWDIHMELPYGTLTDDEMRALRIGDLAESGVLFLWVTGRVMEVARRCMETWGYKFCEELLWIKTNQLHKLIRTGRTGHWLNHSKEHCLVGVKGNVESINRRIDCDVIVSEVRETSRKPDEIYEILERLCPNGRKIEIFGRRHNCRPGWVVLGNQLPGVKLTDPATIERFKEKYPDQVSLLHPLPGEEKAKDDEKKGAGDVKAESSEAEKSGGGEAERKLASGVAGIKRKLASARGASSPSTKRQPAVSSPVLTKRRKTSIEKASSPSAAPRSRTTGAHSKGTGTVKKEDSGPAQMSDTDAAAASTPTANAEEADDNDPPPAPSVEVVPNLSAAGRALSFDQAAEAEVLPENDAEEEEDPSTVVSSSDSEMNE